MVSACRFRSVLQFAGTVALFSSLACILSSVERREKQLGGTIFSSEAVFPPRPIDFHHVKMKSDVSSALLFWSLAFAQLPNKAAASANADSLSPLIHSVWTAGGPFVSEFVYCLFSDFSLLGYTIVFRSYWGLSRSRKNNYYNALVLFSPTVTSLWRGGERVFYSDLFNTRMREQRPSISHLCWENTLLPPS